MTRIPRQKPPAWDLILLWVGLLSAIGVIVVCLLRHPPVPTPPSYVGRDTANPWKIP